MSNFNFGLKMVRSQFISQASRVLVSSSSNINSAASVSNRSSFLSAARAYHQTKNNKTILISSKPSSEYALMSVNSLKNECRKRGIKVSGRKNELVNRLVNSDTKLNDGAREIHTSLKTAVPSSTGNVSLNTSKSQNNPSKANKSTDSVRQFSNSPVKNFTKSEAISAKGDTSHIDYIKSPDLLNEPQEIETPISIISLATPKSKEQQDFRGKKVAQQKGPEATSKANVLTVDDSRPVSTDSPVHKNLDVNPSPKATTINQSSASTIDLSSGDNATSSDADFISRFPESFSSLIQSITSTPDTVLVGESSSSQISSTSENVYQSVTQATSSSSSSNNTKSQGKYKYQEVKFSEYEKTFFGTFAAGVAIYWLGFNFFEEKKSK